MTPVLIDNWDARYTTGTRVIIAQMPYVAKDEKSGNIYAYSKPPQLSPNGAAWLCAEMETQMVRLADPPPDVTLDPRVLYRFRPAAPKAETAQAETFNPYKAILA